MMNNIYRDETRKYGTYTTVYRLSFLDPVVVLMLMSSRGPGDELQRGGDAEV